MFWKARKKLSISNLTGQLPRIISKLYYFLNSQNMAFVIICNFWPWTLEVHCSAAFDTFSSSCTFHSATLFRQTLIVKSYDFSKIFWVGKPLELPPDGGFSRDQDRPWHTWNITISVPEKKGWWSEKPLMRRWVSSSVRRGQNLHPQNLFPKDSRSGFRLRVLYVFLILFRWFLSASTHRFG